MLLYLQYYVDAQCRSQVCDEFASTMQDTADCGSNNGVILRHEGRPAFNCLDITSWFGKHRASSSHVQHAAGHQGSDSSWVDTPQAHDQLLIALSCCLLTVAVDSEGAAFSVMPEYVQWVTKRCGDPATTKAADCLALKDKLCGKRDTSEVRVVCSTANPTYMLPMCKETLQQPADTKASGPTLLTLTRQARKQQTCRAGSAVRQHPSHLCLLSLPPSPCDVLRIFHCRSCASPTTKPHQPPRRGSRAPAATRV
jgi:hypothetical protein